MNRYFLVLCSRALLALLVIAPLLMIAAPAAAQDLDCFETIWRTIETPNPFTGGVIRRDVKNGSDFDEDCYTVQDDRVNQDNASPIAIYCRADGISFWTIDLISRGTPSFFVTWPVLDAFPAGAENTLILEEGGFRLYRLTSGELQVNGPPDWEGKEYVFTWAGCERPAA
jgi:hypothetical protein